MGEVIAPRAVMSQDGMRPAPMPSRKRYEMESDVKVVGTGGLVGQMREVERCLQFVNPDLSLGAASPGVVDFDAEQTADGPGVFYLDPVTAGRHLGCEYIVAPTWSRRSSRPVELTDHRAGPRRPDHQSQ
jgi:hypothetical protein